MCGFWMQNSDFRNRITRICRWIDPTCDFRMQNNDFWTRITSLCGSQTSPVIFCMQNNVPSIRNTSLHGSQRSHVVFGCKSATYGPEKQVSMGLRHHLSHCECKTALLASDLLVSMCPNPHLCFFLMQYSAFWTRISSLYGSQSSPAIFACKTAWLASELLVFMGPSPHVWILDAKQRLLDRINKSLWVPGITCRFVHAKQRA